MRVYGLCTMRVYMVYVHDQCVYIWFMYMINAYVYGLCTMIMWIYGDSTKTIQTYNDGADLLHPFCQSKEQPKKLTKVALVDKRQPHNRVNGVGFILIGRSGLRLKPHF